jgi:hypothetical protein
MDIEDITYLEMTTYTYTHTHTLTSPDINVDLDILKLFCVPHPGLTVASQKKLSQGNILGQEGVVRSDWK